MANSYDQIEEIGMAMFSTNYQYYISDDEKNKKHSKKYYGQFKQESSVDTTL